MKAAVYYENGGPEVLKYEDVADPVCPPDGVVVDVEVISLEGGDTLHRARTPLPSGLISSGTSLPARSARSAPTCRG
jgi:NADPH2:quinone reductase